MEQVAPYTPTQDEKMTAMLAHLLQIFMWLMGPLVIYVVKRDSRFVAFHSVQALIYQGLLMVGSIMIGILWIGSWIYVAAAQESGRKGPPLILFIIFAVFGLGWAVVWTLTLVLSIVHSVKAMNGESSEYPLIGRWARRWYGSPRQQDPSAVSNASPQSPS